MDNADMVLGRADITSIFEGNPRMSRFVEHCYHLSPEVFRPQFAKKTNFPPFRLRFVLPVPFLKLLAVEIMQIGNLFRRKKRPRTVLYDPLHKEVWDPVGGVGIMGSPPVVAGVFPKFQEVLNIVVPGFKINAGGAAPLAASVYRRCSGVNYLQEGNKALPSAIGVFNLGAGTANVC